MKPSITLSEPHGWMLHAVNGNKVEAVKELRRQIGGNRFKKELGLTEAISIVENFLEVYHGLAR